MKLQDFYNQLISLARQNPAISNIDSEFPDPCHKVNPEEPPLCFSPEDLRDPEAKTIIYFKDEKTLGPMELLEAYRQLIRLDQGDGKFDGKLSSEKLPLPSFRNQRPSALRYYGPSWTPDVRLRTVLTWYQKELTEKLPKPDPSLGHARSFFAGVVAAARKEAKGRVHPLMSTEERFIGETASALGEKGLHYAKNLVFGMINKARVLPYPKEEVLINLYKDEELAKTMHFSHRDQFGEAVVFFTAVFKADGEHYAFHELRGRPLRGLTNRKMGIDRLNRYFRLRKNNKIEPGEYFHYYYLFRDLYLYRYYAYDLEKLSEFELVDLYFRVLVLHEGFHAAAVAKANGDDWSGKHLQEPFDWKNLIEKLQKDPPQPEDTEKFVDYLANLLQLKRAALEVRRSLEVKEETEGLSEGEKEGYRMVDGLEDLAIEASESLIDDAAWKLITSGQKNISLRELPSPRDLLFNPNEEEILTKILPQS